FSGRFPGFPASTFNAVGFGRRPPPGPRALPTADAPRTMRRARAAEDAPDARLVGVTALPRGNREQVLPAVQADSAEEAADHAATSAATRSAFLPVNASQRATITSQNFGSSSIAKHRRRCRSHAMSVVPDPQNGSYTSAKSWFATGVSMQSRGFCV